MDIFTPIASIGNSIFIYRITRDEANQVRNRLALPLLAGSRAEEERATQRGFQHRVSKDSSGNASNYTLFVPFDYIGDKPCPLILFLHGFGDRAAYGRQYLRVGLPTIVERQQDSFQFFILIPQSRDGCWNSDSEDSRRAMEILSSVEKKYRIDPNRIYLTGMSSGGAGVWNLAIRYPDRWAAIVPVSGRRSAGLCRHTQICAVLVF